MSIEEIITDLSVTQGDLEMLQAQNAQSLDLKRAVGQLKACRTSLINHLKLTGQKQEVTQ